ncbi:hypothetical protein FN846DRAFT_578124 [Sphaerosporella brunnea]|uniref:Uncharacterized protein n=1 Tax=Sphaerosporella brunnea TaxID=1250544 RepID=A0A5J5F1B3_9PEZI|nr:hypothetical protein FN846DRAFT_578124 [Sphaerosporella brunnea]
MTDIRRPDSKRPSPLERRFAQLHRRRQRSRSPSAESTAQAKKEKKKKKNRHENGQPDRLGSASTSPSCIVSGRGHVRRRRRPARNMPAPHAIGSRSDNDRQSKAGDVAGGGQRKKKIENHRADYITYGSASTHQPAAMIFLGHTHTYITAATLKRNPNPQTTVLINPNPIRSPLHAHRRQSNCFLGNDVIKPRKILEHAPATMSRSVCANWTDSSLRWWLRTPNQMPNIAPSTSQ